MCLTDCLKLPPTLSGAICAGEGIAEELATGRAQEVMLPEPHDLDCIGVLPALHRSILPLTGDRGHKEREMASLAVERPGALALRDEILARPFAKHLDARFRGRLDVLLKTKSEGHLDAVKADRRSSSGAQILARCEWARSRNVHPWLGKFKASGGDHE